MNLHILCGLLYQRFIFIRCFIIIVVYLILKLNCICNQEFLVLYETKIMECISLMLLLEPFSLTDSNVDSKGSFRFECLSIFNVFFYYYKVCNLMWKTQK